MVALLLLLLLLPLLLLLLLPLEGREGVVAGCTSGLSADQAIWVLREEVSAHSAQCTTATTMYYWYFNYF